MRLIINLNIELYPNPFNSTATIKYSLPFASNVRIAIYDVMGKEVKSFVSNSHVAGIHQLNWNGTNNNGGLVSSGIYFINFMINSVSGEKRSLTKTSKLILLK